MEPLSVVKYEVITADESKENAQDESFQTNCSAKSGSLNKGNFTFKAKGSPDTPRPWVCDICGFPFKLKGNLLEHVRFFHMKGNVPCNYCDRTFPTSNHLRKHMVDHAVERNQCPHCRTKLDDETCTYEIHVKVCKRRPKKSNTSNSPNTPSSLTDDSSDSNGSPKRKKPVNNNNNNNNNTSNNTQIWQCIECCSQFKDEESFHQHQCISTMPCSPSGLEDINSDLTDQSLNIPLTNATFDLVSEPFVATITSNSSNIDIQTNGTDTDLISSISSLMTDVSNSPIPKAHDMQNSNLNIPLVNTADIKLNSEHKSISITEVSESTKPEIFTNSNLSISITRIADTNVNSEYSPVATTTEVSDSTKPERFPNSNLSISITKITDTNVNSEYSPVATSNSSKLDNLNLANPDVKNPITDTTNDSINISTTNTPNDNMNIPVTNTSNHSMNSKLSFTPSSISSDSNNTVNQDLHISVINNIMNLPIMNIPNESINTKLSFTPSSSSSDSNILHSDSTVNRDLQISVINNINTNIYSDFSSNVLSNSSKSGTLQSDCSINQNLNIQAMKPVNNLNSEVSYHPTASNSNSNIMHCNDSFNKNFNISIRNAASNVNSNFLSSTPLNYQPSDVFYPFDSRNSNLNIPSRNTADYFNPNLNLNPRFPSVKNSSLLALANFCSQKPLNTNNCSYSLQETINRSIESIFYKETFSRTMCIPPPPPISQNDSPISSMYNNDFNFVPRSFTPCMFPPSDARIPMPLNFPEHVPNFYPMTNTIRPPPPPPPPPPPYLPYTTSAFGNSPFSPGNPSYLPRIPHPYQTNKMNLQNVHCMDCQYPVYSNQLKTQDIPHRCPYCAMVYRKIECLNNHISSFHVFRTYQGMNSSSAPTANQNCITWCCETCKIRFCDQASYLAHLQQCTLKRYENTEMKNMWVCANCNRSFVSKLHLLEHNAVCQTSVTQVKSQTCIKNLQDVVLTSASERYGKKTEISNKSTIVTLENTSKSLTQNLIKKCKTCGQTVYGKYEELCMFCWLKITLSKDFKKLENSELSLPFSSQSVLYQPINSHTFQANTKVLTPVSLCDRVLSFRCHFCECHFNNVASFQRHLINCYNYKTESIRKVRIICCYCSHVYTEISSFQIHNHNCLNSFKYTVRSDKENHVISLQSYNSSRKGNRFHQTVINDKKIWECKRCSEIFSSISLYTAHFAFCKNNSLLNHRKINSHFYDYNNFIWYNEHYCVKCGFCFEDKQKLTNHPCKQILKHMTSCFVLLEPLTGNKIMLMAQLLSRNGYSKKLLLRKKQCLSYRERYNEIFSQKNKCKNFKENLKTFQRNIYNFDLCKKQKLFNKDNLSVNLFTEYEKLFYNKVSRYTTAIYSHKFYCTCGEVRPYLQASIHMKIQRYNKTHQIKLLKPLWPTGYEKFHCLKSFPCKNCKRIIENIEFFAGHITFSNTCRVFYKKMVKKLKLKKEQFVMKHRATDSVTICAMNDKQSNGLVGTEVLDKASKISEPDKQLQNNSDQSNCKIKNSSNTSLTLPETDTSSIHDTVPSVSCIEFADKIANCMKEISSKSIEQEKKRKQMEKLNLHPNSNKLIKKLSNCDGWMIEFDSAMGDWRYNMVIKYICATCYKSLFSKAALIDHLKKEHDTQGVIKLSVIKKQKSDSTAQSINSIECNGDGNFPVNNHSVERSSWSPVITNTFSLSTSKFDCLQE